MTLKEIIEKVTLSGEIPDSIKYRWVGELDGENYRYPEDADVELKYSFKLYQLYLIAMNEFFTGDLSNYAASAILFEKAYAEEKIDRMRKKLEVCGDDR